MEDLLAFSTGRFLLFSLLSAKIIFIYSFFLYGGLDFPIISIILALAFLTVLIVFIKLKKGSIIIKICFVVILILSFPLSIFAAWVSFFTIPAYPSGQILGILFNIVIFFIASSYLITYIIFFKKTLKCKTLSLYSFIPIVYSLLLIVIFLLWFWKMNIMNFK